MPIAVPPGRAHDPPRNPVMCPMVWIGGGPGAGKSTLARQLAHEHDLPLHRIDAWTYDHARRMPPDEPLDVVLGRGPQAAATTWWRTSESRLGLVLDDVQARDPGTVPVVVEGPQLHPDAAARLGVPAIWLLPHPEQTRRARSERLVSAGSERERRDVGRLVDRDALLTRDILEAARRRGQPVITVGADPDWSTVGRTLRETLGNSLQRASRLEAQGLNAARRFENATIAAQLTAYQQDQELTSDPVFPFACECGRSGCDAVVRLTAANYTAHHSAPHPLLAPEHRKAGVGCRCGSG